MSQQLLVEYDDEIVDAKLLNKNPETAMKVLIAQQSSGKFNPDMLHLIIRSIMNENNNNLKRLLYYFFEGLDKTDKSFMICMNQVNKDLNSPNEFVRGFVLKFIAKLDDFEYVSLLFKGVRDNLNHSNSYVRMNALFCLGELGARFDLDVEQDITHLIKKESSPETLIIGFNAMHKLGMNFEDFLETTYPKDVLQALADKTDDIQFLRKLLESKFNPVAFIASCKLLSKQNAINHMWSKIITNHKVQSSSKYKIFESAVRAIMCYGGQVWGFKEWESVEKLQRFFLKKMFYLPRNTPNYMLSIETGINQLYMYTLHLHFDYIRRVLSLPDTRLPKVLANIILQTDIYWALEWKQLFNSTQTDFDVSYHPEDWKLQHKFVLTKLAFKKWEENVTRAHASVFHDAYPNLQYTDVPNYFSDENPLEMISLIFKARGGLLDINAKAFKKHTTGICSFCDLDESENTFHFIAQCPIFRNYRLQYFQKEKITSEEFYELLNGKNYNLLYHYLKSSLKYRTLLINEFN